MKNLFVPMWKLLREGIGLWFGLFIWLIFLGIIGVSDWLVRQLEALGL